MTARLAPHAVTAGDEAAVVGELLRRARAAQAAFADADQDTVDRVVTGAGWAIMEPARNRLLAEQAVRETGLGKVDDKVRKNHRKTLGLLRDLQGARSVGILSEDRTTGITEIARPVGVVAAITPSTNPAATPANNIINALKGRNAIILAPSPKGAGTCATLVGFVQRELEKVGVPADLVQMLPPPASKALMGELMRQADLVVATGSRANVRAAYASGTPALGVGAGNVAAIVMPGADFALTAERIAASKTFDNATSCSSENSLVVVGDAWEPLLAALAQAGGVLATAEEQARLEAAMFPGGKADAAFIAQSAPRVAALAGLTRTAYAGARFILVREQGVGPDHPFSGEKLSPVLTLYRVADFDAAIAQVGALYEYQGKGHSVGVHGATADEVLRLGFELPVCRVIVEQTHCVAVGGAFDNGLPFSLSMGCGTWGGNGFSDNLNYRHFLNVTRIVRTIPAREPDEASVFGDYWRRYGR
ncbi:sulfoacetaldehyde dehydrogenase [Aromatoleum tolulyticum]|uniref:Sulfoacetaldehyde dehydrogenase n=1 Tax=Aromatoleum tolulyticum TaxID=34027 RepID=A0A1N6XL05_9RHOO|nr:aldehyde dehydrogenase family protein [Aromatoleum tolulyticum]SIR02937.1 sulfoacetaldehyde dehydrogenase [Aromatoleum tolulyticum]